MDNQVWLWCGLSQAEENGNIQEVVEILSFQEKMKALPIAVEERFYKVVDWLLEHGLFDVHYVDRYQNNRMQLLLNSYDGDLLLPSVVKLVDLGVDVNHVNKDKETPIFIAAGKGLYEVMIYLLKHGVDVHYVDRFKCMEV